MILLALTVVLHRDRLFDKRSYQFTSVYGAFYGGSGRTYVIDKGREVIAVLEENDTVSDILNGGNINRFFYAEEVAEGNNGLLYILDESYSGNDEKDASLKYRIISYSGGKYSVLYNSGRNVIYDMQYGDGMLHFLREEEFGLGLYDFTPGEEPKLIKRIYSGDILNDASIDLSTGLIAIATKRGAVRIQKSAFSSWFTLKNDNTHIMPRSISARNGRIFFSELYIGGVCAFSDVSTETYDVLYSSDGLKINSVNADSSGERLLCSDLISFYKIDTSDGSVKCNYQEEAEFTGFYKTVIVRVLLFLCFIILLYFMRIFPGIIIKLVKNESALRMAAVVLAVITVSGFIASSLLSDERIKEDKRDIEEMKLFSDVILDYLDQNTLSKIKWEYDYMGSAYMKFRSTLDIPFMEAERLGKKYYYTFYTIKDGAVRYILDYSDDVMCGEPCGKINDNYIRDCYYNGTSYALKNRDSEGTWINILQPVKNSHGKIIAAIEIGTDLNFREQERSVKTRDTIINVFCSSAVVMMLIIEVLFLITFYEKKIHGTEKRKDATTSIPLRTVMTLAYLSAAMQDPFITMLASRVYNNELMIPREMATGLPLTAQFLMMAICSPLAGRLTERIGSKKILYAGLTADLLGFVVCTVFSGTYLGILFGNMLIGAGVGTLLVTSNVIAAKGETMEATADAFAGIMAGSMSGFTIGAGLSALIYPLGGSRLSYFIAGVFMLPVVFLIRYSDNVVPDKKDEAENDDKISFAKFFFNPRVMGYFVFILVPFMTSISYREYFFPLYVMDKGMDEVRVGQVFLLCGLMVIYVGSYISSAIIKRFGTFWSVIIASVTMGINLLIFASRPSLVTAILGLVLLSVIISFAYTCQYTYFEQLPDSLMYGDGKAMGVYSVFENLGQTVGPMIYGALLLLGDRKGIGLFGIIMILFTALYALFMGRERKFFH